MAMQMSSDRAVCAKCGEEYSRRKGYFPVSYAASYKGLGYVPICGRCIESLYNGYLAQCGNSRDAVRQVCRKLDLYWSGNVFDAAEKKATTKSIMHQYIIKINTATYAGKSYDDTLSAEGELWAFRHPVVAINSSTGDSSQRQARVDEIEITPEIQAMWGPGYSMEMLQMLEQRRRYWLTRLPEGVEMDIGAEAIIKQISSLELDINRDRAAGKPVDKNVNLLNQLLGSANLKPSQKQVEKSQDTLDTAVVDTPLGVWLYRYENKRPLPEIDDDLKDVNHVLRYVFTWLGHIFKMLNKKNGCTQLYEKEIERLRIERPEFADEDDTDLLVDALGDNDDIDFDIPGGDSP